MNTVVQTSFAGKNFLQLTVKFQVVYHAGSLVQHSCADAVAPPSGSVRWQSGLQGISAAAVSEGMPRPDLHPNSHAYNSKHPACNSNNPYASDMHLKHLNYTRQLLYKLFFFIFC